MRRRKKPEKKYLAFLLKLAYFDFGLKPEISDYDVDGTPFISLQKPETFIYDEVGTPFISLLYEYSKFLAGFEPQYPFIKSQEKYNVFMDGLIDRSSEVHLPRRIQFFREIQKHVLSQVEKIMDAGTADINKERAPLFSMPGNHVVYYNAASGTFKGRFRPVIKKDNPSAQLDLGEEKQILDLILSDLMTDYGLRADRFLRCERCSNIFYQYTANEKIYCTTRCSNAVRQSKFVDKTP